MPFADFVLLFVLNTSPDALCRVFFFKFAWFVSRMSPKTLNPWEESACDPCDLFEPSKGQ